MSIPRSRRSRRLIAGAATATALPSILAPQIASATARGADEPASLASPAGDGISGHDPFGPALLALPSRPMVWSGRIVQGAEDTGGATTAFVAPAGQVRIDVYLIPITPGPLHPLVFTFADASGGFTITADPPEDLAAYADPGGLINASVVYADLASGASRLGHEQLRWDAGGGQWQRLTPSDPRTGAAPPVALAAAPADPRRTSLAATTGTYVPPCRPYFGSQYQAIELLPQPPTWVNVFDVLAEDRSGNDWTISGNYQTASSTYTENHHSVALSAGFETKFPGVNLEVSGESVLSSGTGNTTNTSLGFGFQLENVVPENRVATNAVGLGRTLNLKYGIQMDTNARLYECVDITASYEQGHITYSPAFYAIEVGSRLDFSNQGGFVSRPALFLAPDQATGAPYLRPCNTTHGDAVWAVAAGSFFERQAGRSQAFENGSQVTYSASLKAVAAASATTEDRQTSRVEAQTNVTSRWDNGSTGQKYVCGYNGISPATEGTAGVIVGIGAKHNL